MFLSDLIYILFSLMMMICFVIAEKRGLFRTYSYAKLIAFLPFLIMVFSIKFNTYDACLLPFYIASGAFTLCFALKDQKQYLTVLMISAVLSLSSFVPCSLSENYRKPGWMAEFNEIFTLMRRHYVLSDYKQIDWDALYDKYAPQIDALEKDQREEYYQLWYLLSLEFHDAHVSVMPEEVQYDAYAMRRITDALAGRDPGFSIVRLDDGTVLACNVEEHSDAWNAGLRTGMQIVSLDGQEISERIDMTEVLFMPFPDLENENFFRPTAACNIRGVMTEVSFLNEEGELISAEILTEESYADRQRETVHQLLGVDEEEQLNFSLSMVSDKTACLILNDFMVDANKFFSKEDLQRWKELVEQGTDFAGIKIAMENHFKELEANGAENLIIDLRSNSGGYVQAAGFTASYFTDKPLFLDREEYKNETTGQMIQTDPEYTDANHQWGDGNIILLVNASTVSAAELFINTMSELPNVTVMGVTKTMGSAMGVTETKLNKTIFQFPIFRTIDENGEILIDSDASRVSRLDPDVKLSFDRAMFDSIFAEHTDPVLEAAVQYAETQG